MKISVITASYNYANYIQEAIESIINQSFQDWELIIVDDGSSDNSVEIIKSYCQKDYRIKLFQHEEEKNKGLKETLLLGLEKSTGEWIAFLESDDILEPDNLLKKTEIVEKYPNVGLVFNKVKFFGEKKRVEKLKKDLSPTYKKLSKMSFPKNMFFNLYQSNLILTFSCVMVKKEALKIDFNSPSDALLDWWLWIQIAQNYHFYYIDEPLTKWRLHFESYIQKSDIFPFFPISIAAYNRIYKKNKKNPKLLLFISLSFVILCITRLFKKISTKINKLIEFIQKK